MAGTTESAELRRCLKSALTELEDHGTAASIAAFLAAEGFTGYRNTPRACPVARFTAARIYQLRPSRAKVIAAASATTVYTAAGRKHAWLETPPEVALLIRRFDDGELPELEENP